MQQIHRFSRNGINIVLDVNSGAVHQVDKLVWDILDYYKKIDDHEIVDILSTNYSNVDIVEALVELKELEAQGLLYSDDEEYSDILSTMEAKPIIKAMCLHLAHDCNMRCRYCFASTGSFGGQRSMMTFDVGRAALDFLVSHSGQRKHLEVDFFGGEPLMNFDVMKKLVQYGRYLQNNTGKIISFTVTTNGLVLDDEKIEYINENMDNVVLSLDGRQYVNDMMRRTIDGKGTYDIIVPKFLKLVDGRHRGSYYVRGTFTRYNLDFVEDVIHMVDLGFDQISMEPVTAKDVPYALTKENLPLIFQQYDLLVDKFIEYTRRGHPFTFFHFMIDLQQGPCVAKRLLGCGAGAEYVAVTPQGDIYPCHQFVGQMNFIMGNVLKNTLDQNLQRMFAQCHIYTKSQCKHCWARFYCSGGCAANAYTFNGSISQPYELYCAMEKKRIECALTIKAILDKA